MNATVTRAGLNYYYNTIDEPTAGIRALRNSILSELPGITFAVITLAYVVLSFAGLK